MPDPTTLYAVAAVITALSPVAVAAIVETGRFLRSRRARGETQSRSHDGDCSS